MKLIYDIVRKLSKQELRMIRQQIRNSAFEYEKMGKLFDLVTRYDERDEEFYAKKLYNKPPDNTFRVTKSRLKRMLENVLLNDKSLNSYPAEYVNAKLQVQKKLLQGEILLGRGAYEASTNLLLQVISTSKKYQLHDEIFRAELLLYRKDRMRSTVKDFEKRKESLIEKNQEIAWVNEGMILHYAISNLINNKTLNPEHFPNIRQQIDRIKEIYETTQQIMIQRAYYLSEIYFHQLTESYQQALEFCKKYLAHIKENKSNYTDHHLGIAYGQLAQVSLHLNKLDKAEEYTSQTLQIFAQDSMNSLNSLELKFHIYFRQSKYEKAADCIEQARGHSQFTSSKFIEAKWHYFHACVLFQTRKFQEAYMELNYTTPLMSDKFGLNLYIRLLEIMIMYELKHLDLMETKILNLRQFVKRTQQNKDTMYARSLIEILTSWYKSNYNFAETVKVFQQVNAENKNQSDSYYDREYYHHEYYGHELVKLTEWLIANVKEE